MDEAKRAVSALSKDAKAILGAYFGMGNMDSSVTFNMVHSRPTERAKKALDECVAAKVLSVEPFNKFGGVIYRPLIAFHTQRKIIMAAALAAKGFTLTEPIAQSTRGGV